MLAGFVTLTIALFVAALVFCSRKTEPRERVLLVGNCLDCRASETEISGFKGKVVRFNGSLGGRTDVMIWADDLFYSPEGKAARKKVPLHVRHMFRSDVGLFSSLHSTGFMTWEYCVKKGYDVYCTGFDFGKTVSESTSSYSRKKFPHAWREESRVAREDPRWKTFHTESSYTITSLSLKNTSTRVRYS